MRTLTRRELHRALLARQGLKAKKDGPRGGPSFSGGLFGCLGRQSVQLTPTLYVLRFADAFRISIRNPEPGVITLAYGMAGS